MPPGRRTKLTEGVSRILVEAVRKGVPVEIACQKARIGTTTYYEWQKRGEEGKEPYASFLGDLKEADADFVEEAMDNLRASALSGNDRAAMFMLRVRHPEHFSEKQSVELSGSVGCTPLPVFGGELGVLTGGAVDEDGEAEDSDPTD